MYFIISVMQYIENRGIKLLLGFDDVSGYIFIAFRDSNIENWIQNMNFNKYHLGIIP